jgi:hypothetical protein
LKGAGVALALPVLNAMGKVLPGAAADAAASRAVKKAVQAPVRMAAIYFPNGVWEKNWFPQEGGADYKMPFALEPLEQWYERLDKNLYRYESAGGRFVARVGVDEMGLVTDYGDIWAREEINR